MGDIKESEHSVADVETDSILDGVPSDELVARSLAAGAHGIVSAYLDAEGTWQYLDDSRVEDFTRMGHEVRAVYVEVA